MIRRSGARPGDAIYVTGTIGDSGLGLALLKKEIRLLDAAECNRLIARYRLPQPPVAFGSQLAAFAHASADISDGLVADLGHVARASGVKMIIDAAAIPRSPIMSGIGEGQAAMLRAATAGDDYQIAFTADPVRERKILDAAAAWGIAVTRIGRVETGEGVELLLKGQVLDVPNPGFRHF